MASTAKLMRGSPRISGSTTAWEAAAAAASISAVDSTCTFLEDMVDACVPAFNSNLKMVLEWSLSPAFLLCRCYCIGYLGVISFRVFNTFVVFL